jgi:hypothetical protein
MVQKAWQLEKKFRVSCFDYLKKEKFSIPDVGTRSALACSLMPVAWTKYNV